MSPEIAVPMMVFGLPVAIVFIVKYFKFREKQLEAGAGGPKLLPGVRADYEAKQRELEARIENLESALIAMDSSDAPRLAAKKQAAALPAERNPLPALPAKKPAEEE